MSTTPIDYSRVIRSSRLNRVRGILYRFNKGSRARRNMTYKMDPQIIDSTMVIITFTTNDAMTTDDCAEG